MKIKIQFQTQIASRTSCINADVIKFIVLPKTSYFA